MKLLIFNKKMIYLTLLLLIFIILISLVIINYGKTKDVFMQDIFYEGINDKKIISFACNIDWGEEYIPQMLNIFKKNDIKITFFPTGKWAEKNPEILEDIFRNGHEIGNHGYSHIDYDKLDYEQNFEQIQKTDNIINKITNTKSMYFAPPSGAFNDYTIKAAKDLDYKVIMWSIDTIDWREDSTRELIAKRVIDKAHNSAIVLMHPTENTVNALEEIIDELRKMGFKIGKISDVLNN
ncbi:MAG: polysaccharide deacetylase family protein [Tissierella sp.]|uniref:polysaccharide deacetylase family protein n=1 Tax=Tissierella sp. TaxID=41274 RepID=UPI003F97B25B